MRGLTSMYACSDHLFLQRNQALCMQGRLQSDSLVGFMNKVYTPTAMEKGVRDVAGRSSRRTSLRN